MSGKNWKDLNSSFVSLLSFASGVVITATLTSYLASNSKSGKKIKEASGYSQSSNVYSNSEQSNSHHKAPTPHLTHEEYEITPKMLKKKKESSDARVNVELVGGLANQIASRVDFTKGQALVVAVAGGTGSGKTTLTRAIYDGLHDDSVTYISHDNYYKDLSHLSMEDRAKNNFDHPDSLETDLLVHHIKELKAGRKVQIPEYDFTTHCRRKETMLALPKKVILIEGILIFTHPELNEIADIKIFVDTEADIRLIRRIERDRLERGRSLESIIEQYMSTVRPMHEQFVEPSKRSADIIVPFGLNTVVLEMVLSHLQDVIRM
mmetsp:Transcript_4635/g.6097  ORF Transcript_4635/g.6097 Transcript_4635/m.6097 type:complete len:321 (-) Transcript_4635:296-1258(-)